ncbi:hypothetical protein M3J09_006312 [Ascochyta lentis]
MFASVPFSQGPAKILPIAILSPRCLWSVFSKRLFFPNPCTVIKSSVGDSL